ncbi:MAG: protein-L-isoaspartate(D-aspartate) O-methyltransferase [Acidocella sp.]|nr:protein-L-isoaspartate(D-aspartate) O-methyltransferase [Acidocella sp.]
MTDQPANRSARDPMVLTPRDPMVLTPRDHMVDSQIRPNQVNDSRVIAAMRNLDRAHFAPPGALAYADADIALGAGRFLLAPMVTARLAQAVLATSPATILVIGAGSGYLASVLAACGPHVTALDDETATPSRAQGADIVTGPLTLGWPAAGPYEAIVIEGAVPAIPASLAGQLAPGGRVVTILADGPHNGDIGRAVAAVPSKGGFALLTLFDCTARILPAFEQAPAFQF